VIFFRQMTLWISKLRYFNNFLFIEKFQIWFGILLPKLFWPTVRKNCSSDWEFFLKFEAEGREFANILRSLEQFVRTVKGQIKLWWQNVFLTCSWGILRYNN
jgi:hypothetical protein